MAQGVLQYAVALAWCAISRRWRKNRRSRRRRRSGGRRKRQMRVGCTVPSLEPRVQCPDALEAESFPVLLKPEMICATFISVGNSCGTPSYVRLQPVTDLRCPHPRRPGWRFGSNSLCATYSCPRVCMPFGS